MQVAIVLFTVFTATMANGTVFATLGLFGREAGLGEFEVGMVFASSGVLFFLTASAWGRLSDRFGRGAIMAAGLAATALSLTLFAAFYAALLPYTFLGLLVALAALAIVGVREGPRPAAMAQAEGAPVDGLAAYALLAFVMVLGFGAMQPTMAFYVQDRFGLETEAEIRATGYASAAFAAGAFLMQAFGVRALALEMRDMMALGFVLCLAGIAGTLVARSPNVLIAAFPVLGVGYGLAQAGLMIDAARLGGEHRQGLVTGRLQAGMAAGWIVGALAGTALYGLSIRAPILIAGAALALCALRTALPGVRTPSAPPP